LGSPRSTTPARGNPQERSFKEFVAALSVGTARAAALIAPQEPSALPAIINDIAGQAECFRRNDHLAIPMTAVLAHGRKSRMTTIDSCEARTA
jgi:hypothetical protein